MKTPLKKGLGSYTKKSKGNRGYKMSGPSLLKMVADSKKSPITNEFGIGKGTSPYRDADTSGDGGKGKKILSNLANMFMAGVNNVYGKPGETKSSDALTKSEAENEALKEQLTIAQKIIKGEKKG